MGERKKEQKISFKRATKKIIKKNFYFIFDLFFKFFCDFYLFYNLIVINLVMGAKASTPNNGGQSPRTRTFSTSSSSDVVSGNTTSYNIMRGIPGIHISTNHQRHSVPNHNDGISIPSGNSQSNQISTGSPESSNDDESSASGAVGMGRGVFTATSLPSHIWSLNGEFLFVK